MRLSSLLKFLLFLFLALLSIESVNSQYNSLLFNRILSFPDKVFSRTNSVGGLIMPLLVKRSLNFSFFVLLFLCINNKTNAQNADRRIRIDQKVLGFTFTMPDGYQECDSGFTHICRDSKLSNAILYSIIKKDSSIKIGFSFIPLVDSVAIQNIRFLNPGVDAIDWNKNFLRSALKLADTVNSTIAWYDSSYTRRVFNADHALAISRNCRVPFQGYEHNRLVYIAKDGGGHIELVYLFNENAKKNIDEEIKKTQGMIYYKNVQASEKHQ